MSLFRREARQWTAEPFVPPFPGAPGFGGGMSSPTIDRALQVSTVWACVSKIASAVSMMPLEAYTIRNDARVPLPTPSLIAQPSQDATMPEWIYMTLVALLLRGNSYGHIVARDSMQYPTQIELYNPDEVSPYTKDDGRLGYRVKGVDVDPRNIQHIRAWRMPGRRTGLSPIEYAAKQINTDAAIADFAFGFFRDGAHPSAILSTDASLDQNQAKQLKDRFLAAVKGREPAVMSSGINYEQIQVTPEESQFLATQKFGVNEIAKIFNVPPEMVGGTSGGTMTYQNVEQQNLDFLTFTLQPWLTRLETALSAALPGKQHLRFDTSVLMRTDLETTFKATAIGIASKQMTPDEARALRDMAPLTEEQKALLELVPLDVGPTGSPKPLPPAAEGEPA